MTGESRKPSESQKSKVPTVMGGSKAGFILG